MRTPLVITLVGNSRGMGCRLLIGDVDVTAYLVDYRIEHSTAGDEFGGPFPNLANGSSISFQLAGFQLDYQMVEDAKASTSTALARLQTNPSIEQAAFVERLPLIDVEPTRELEVEGRQAGRPEDRPWAVVATVSDRYFAAVGMPLVAGRGFTDADLPERQPVAVINREMARRFWGSPEKALGARVATIGERGGVLEIVGVTSDVLRGDREAVNPQLFVSSRQRPARSVSLVVRAADPAAIAATVRDQIRAIDRDVPVYDVRPFQQVIDEDLSSSRILGSLFGSFALLALVLAASGLYGVVSYAASQRVKEFGVRVALGASAADIARMMLTQTGRLVAIGLVLGLAGGRLLAIGATSLLYRVSPSDPATYAGVAVVLAAVALLATYIPVRRATSIDPVTALRAE